MDGTLAVRFVTSLAAPCLTVCGAGLVGVSLTFPSRHPLHSPSHWTSARVASSASSDACGKVQRVLPPSATANRGGERGERRLAPCVVQPAHDGAIPAKPSHADAHRSSLVHQCCSRRQRRRGGQDRIGRRGPRQAQRAGVVCSCPKRWRRCVKVRWPVVAAPWPAGACAASLACVRDSVARCVRTASGRCGSHWCPVVRRCSGRVGCLFVC